MGLAPASFAELAARAGTGVVHRDVVDPPLVAELSILWTETAAGVVATARRCAERHGWLR